MGLHLSERPAGSRAGRSPVLGPSTVVSGDATHKDPNGSGAMLDKLELRRSYTV
jgi:hypothetical protein